MSSRSEYLHALLTAHPDLVVTTFFSFFLCASVFLGVLVLKNKEKYKYAAELPLANDCGDEQNERSV